MDARVVFWSGALINMAVVVGLAVYGVHQIRRGNTPSHRRSMQAAASLVALFLVSYLLKRVWIGAEELDLWSRPALINLWIHETMVAGMLIAGGLALFRGRRLAGTRRVTGLAGDPAAEASALRGHRRLGRVAVVCAALGLVTACGILAQIFGLGS